MSPTCTAGIKSVSRFSLYFVTCGVSVTFLHRMRVRKLMEQRYACYQSEGLYFSRAAEGDAHIFPDVPGVPMDVFALTRRKAHHIYRSVMSLEFQGD